MRPVQHLDLERYFLWLELWTPERNEPAIAIRAPRRARLHACPLLILPEPRAVRFVSKM